MLQKPATSLPRAAESQNLLGAFVRQRRDDLNMTQTDLAAKMGVSQGTISDIERGRVNFPAKHIRRALAEALAISHMDIVLASGELDADEIRGARAPHAPGSLMHEWMSLGESIEGDDAMMLTAIMVVRGLIDQSRRFPGLTVTWKTD